MCTTSQTIEFFVLLNVIFIECLLAILYKFWNTVLKKSYFISYFSVAIWNFQRAINPSVKKIHYNYSSSLRNWEIFWQVNQNQFV